MKNNLKEKLENLSSNFSNDLDIISLKALCTVEQNEQTQVAIKEILERLIKKYPDNEEISDLLPQEENIIEERISIEELIEILEQKYLNNVEVTTIKALYNLPDSEEKENAIKKCLERLLELNSDDEDILNYLGIKRLSKNCLLNWISNICSAYEKQREEEGNPIPDEEKFDVEAFARTPAGRSFAVFGETFARKINERLEYERQEKILKKN